MEETLHYTMSGSGPPLVFVHGWAMHSGVWQQLAKAFADEFTVIAPDLRGHNRSRDLAGPCSYEVLAGDIQGLVSRLGLHGVSYVGWSMGVSLLLKMVGMYQPEMRALVCISGNPSFVKRSDYEAGLPEVSVRRLAKQVGRDYPGGLDYFYRLLGSVEELQLLKSSGSYAVLADPQAVPTQAVALETLACLQHEDVRQELGAVAAPTLIIQGSADRITHPQAATYMHRRIPGAELCMIEGAGHVPFLTHRDKVVGAMRGFFN
ncbi:MAG: alpha/beta fold hydrolase [Deltaproteobacteria bacterium]|nr:alpha/beta fold hydrolase [Deltaproteobacteria bacterium]